MTEAIDPGRMLSMAGRRVLITGAAGHLGSATARALAALGADLLLTDLPRSGLQAISAQLLAEFDVRVEVAECELEDESDRNALIGAAGSDGLNVIVHNAAFVGTSELDGWATPFDQQSLGAWRRAIEVNLTASFHLTQGLAPVMRESGGASIVQVASIYGLVGPDWSLYAGTDMANPAAYAASKGGVLQLTRWLATTLGPEIRVNAVAPGGILRGQPAEFVERYERRTPLARMGHVGDMVGTVAYLASDLSAYVTGQVIAVDGGWTAW